MESNFEKDVCLATGVSMMLLSFLIVVPNGIVLYALYRNPLRCFRKTFSVFLGFISGVDFFIGTVICIGGTTIRYLCAFGYEKRKFCLGENVDFIAFSIYIVARGIQNYKIGFQLF